MVKECGMNETIKKEAILLDYETDSWEDAVLKAGTLLCESGLAEMEYARQMVKTVQDYGAYMVVAPGFAMPHANAEFGAKGTGISFLRLKDTVIFPNKEDNPVKVLIAVVANNKQLHLQMFGRIAEKILDAGSREKLTVSEDIDEIYDFLNG